MRKLRRLDARAFKNEDVLVGVRKMVLAPDDVADTQIDVVRARGKMVGGHAVGPKQREVFDVVSGFNLPAINGVMETDLFACSARNPEAKRKRLSGRCST